MLRPTSGSFRLAAGWRRSSPSARLRNINTIVVDVKPLSGLVLYKSAIAPRLREFEGRNYPADYDLLRTVIEEGHKAGIAVHAAINVFSEGSQKLGDGPALTHPDWQCVGYELDRSITAGNGPNTGALVR